MKSGIPTQWELNQLLIVPMFICIYHIFIKLTSLLLKSIVQYPILLYTIFLAL